MLKHRLIARLDIKPPNLVKTVRLEGLRVIGDPYEKAVHYNSQGIDEILYLDIVASLYGRNSLADLVAKTTEQVFCPVTVGGGIRTIEDAREMFNSGADKFALNSAAIQRPALIDELARKFGSQAVVIQIDAKRKDDGYEAWYDGGREPSGKDVEDWAIEVMERGAGEILLTSIDHEGTQQGYDTVLVEAIAKIVSIPVIASGGFGASYDAVKALEAGASAVAVADGLHCAGFQVNQIKQCIHDCGYPVRMGE